MERFIVLIDSLGDAVLASFGWIKVDENDEFVLFWNAEYQAHQPVAKASPRFLVLDDWSDVVTLDQPVVQTLRSIP
jgi:hypothetical protein